MASLRYTIVVMGPVYGTQQSYFAYQFIEELLKTPHIVECIFFYGEGVSNASHAVNPANDEFDLHAAWQDLARKFDISLMFCGSAGMRRGINKDCNVENCFKFSSLTELSRLIASSDRVIQF